ncbi:MAG TPA: translational GTPase TypA [Candidatus Pacebacteria bacterium]|nr:translational GTPase TypA [Candidatus Paceibacterota bacterium]
MQIRNVAIIAHVDHGKTTLIDGLLKQTHAFRDNQAEMTQTTILDKNDLEREKGITILAKNTAVFYQDYKINIIDTPGHADFGGEVERVINMADGAILLVDAAEGCLPQTKFVLQQAIKQRLKLIVLVNKIDRKDAEPERVLRQIEELILSLVDAADESFLDFPVLYAVGREGKAWKSLPTDFNAPADLRVVFEQIIETVPAPSADATKPFKMLISNIDFDAYKGTYAIGKVSQGVVRKGQRLVKLAEHELVGNANVQLVMVSNGLNREEVPECQAGDIVALTGIENPEIGQTLADPQDPTGFPMIKLTEPTLKIQVAANTSPFAGREGKFCTIRQIEERLLREKKTNIGLRIEQSSNGAGFMVAGRGELHLAILVETMRREGYELEAGKPQVILKEVDGKQCEPVEELTIDIDTNYIGIITEELGKRQAELLDSLTDDKNVAHLLYRISSRNLLGFRGDILTKTRGNGVFASRFIGYFPLMNVAAKLRSGAIIATDSGNSTSYALEGLQNRGVSFIGPGVPVYSGMIVGLNKQQDDMEFNVCKMKHLTNFRSNADIMIPLNTPMQLSLEQCLDFVAEDEILEVTPDSLRLRKRYLTRNERAKHLR